MHNSYFNYKIYIGFVKPLLRKRNERCQRDIQTQQAKINWQRQKRSKQRQQLFTAHNSRLINTKSNKIWGCYQVLRKSKHIQLQIRYHQKADRLYITILY